MSALDWRELLRDRSAWEAATHTLDDAEEARGWLTDTIMRIDQQFADNRTVGRLPDNEWADHLDWRGAAIGFKRICVTHKRDLDRRIKAMNREQAVADNEAYLLRRARADMLALAEAWDEGHRDVCIDCCCPADRNPYAEATP